GQTARRRDAQSVTDEPFLNRVLFSQKILIKRIDRALAGRAGLRDDRHARVLLPLGQGRQGGASRRPPRGLPRGAPGARLATPAGGWDGMLPPGHRVVGHAPGRRDAPPAPAWKIIKKKSPPRGVEPGAGARIGRGWPWIAGYSRTAPDMTKIGRRPFLR